MPVTRIDPNARQIAKAERYAEAMDKIEDIIIDALPSLILKLKILAEGVEIERRGHDGIPYKVTLPPDRKAAIYLVDRIMGRPARQWAPPTAPVKPLAPVILKKES